MLAAEDSYRQYLLDDTRGRFQSYDDWVADRQKRREVGLAEKETNAYQVDKHWDWRDTEESVIEDLVLGWHSAKVEDRMIMFFVGTLVFGFSWVVLEFMLFLVFNRSSSGGFTWEVPMDTGLIILFALCGTVLGSVAMWCVTTYRLRMAQLQERKEIRQAEVDKEMWKRLPMESMQKAISTR